MTGNTKINAHNPDGTGSTGYRLDPPLCEISAVVMRDGCFALNKGTPAAAFLIVDRNDEIAEREPNDD